MADSTPKSYHKDPQLYLYTSLTSGSSQIVTATSRLQTILKANKIPFQALDVATDEKARMLWGRRAGKRKLPGLVRMGTILGDLDQVEEWNEYGEIKENLGSFAPVASTITPTPSSTNTSSRLPESSAPTVLLSTPTKAPIASMVTPPQPSTEKTASEPPKPDPATNITDTMRQLGFEAAKKAGEAKSKARSETLEAAKAKNPELQKLDNSGPTGMPPPSGTTEVADALKGENGEAAMEGNADTVLAASEEGAQSKNGSTKPLEKSESQAPERDPGCTSSANLMASKDQSGEKDQKQEISIPSTKEIEESANAAIAQDEKEVLEGEGQAEPEVPTAKEVEEEANKAIAEDESSPNPAIGGNKAPTPEAVVIDEAEESAATQEVSLETESVGGKDKNAYTVTRASSAQPAEIEKGTTNGGDREGKHEEGTAEEQKKVANSVILTDKSPVSPVTKTQDQPAASGEDVGKSVAD